MRTYYSVAIIATLMTLLLFVQTETQWVQGVCVSIGAISLFLAVHTLSVSMITTFTRKRSK